MNLNLEKSPIKYKLILARLYDVLFSDLTTLRWSEAWTAIIFGFTLLIFTPTPDNSDQMFLKYIVPLWAWACMFTFYGIFKVALIVSSRDWRKTKITMTSIGLVMWCYVFVTATLLSSFSVTDILFLMPIFAEAWYLAITLGDKNDAVGISSTN